VKKQTAANNPLLLDTKTTFNKKIFKATSKIVNEFGDDAGKDYIDKALYMWPERLETQKRIWEENKK
jgi:hypothetical protein